MDKQTATPDTPSGSQALSIEGRALELTFSETEDISLLDRLRQTLFQVYIQSLTHPVDRKI